MLMINFTKGLQLTCRLMSIPSSSVYVSSTLPIFQDCLVAHFQGQAVHKDRTDRLSQNTGIQLPTYTA